MFDTTDSQAPTPREGESNIAQSKHHAILYSNTPTYLPKSEPKSFARPFIPELRAEIFSYLPGSDLKSCSLTCQAFHADATRYIWRNVHVASDYHGNLEDFFRLMLQYPHRARLVQKFFLSYNTCYHDQTHHWHGKDISLSLWPLFSQALILMNNVSRLDLMVVAERAWSTDPTPRSIPQGLYEGLATAAFTTKLSHLSFDGPRDFTGVCQLTEIFPNLHTLVCYSDNHNLTIPPSPTSLCQLRRAHGPPELLSMLREHSTLDTFQLSNRRLHEVTVSVATVGLLARAVDSLRHLHFCNSLVAQGAENIPRVLPWLAHPKLESLTIDISHNDKWPAPVPITPSMILSPSFIFSFLAPQALTHLPSLRHLHVTHLHERIFDGIVKPNMTMRTITKLYEEESQIVVKALEQCLAAESRYPHSLQRLWIDCAHKELTPVHLRRRLRFSAERDISKDDWIVQVGILWCSEEIDGRLGADFTYSRRFWEWSRGRTQQLARTHAHHPAQQIQQAHNRKQMECNGGPNPRHLFPEIRYQIVSYLTLRDIKSYSLSCRAFNADSQFFLWSSVSVSPTESPSDALDRFIHFLLENPQRAGRIESISFYKIIPRKSRFDVLGNLISFQRDSRLPSVPARPQFLGIEEAFSYLHSLKRLQIAPSSNSSSFINGHTFSPYPQELYDALAGFPATLTLETLIVHEPSDVIKTLLSTFPNIVNLSILTKAPEMTIPSSALSKLRRAHGSNSVLSWLATNRKVDVLEFAMDQSQDEGPVELHSTLPRFPSLTRLSYVGQVNPATINLHFLVGNQINPVNSLAHPTLEELELTLYHTSQAGIIAPSPALLLFSVISPDFLNAFPVLRFLHISHFYQATIPSVQEGYEIGFQSYQNYVDDTSMQEAELQGLGSELFKYLDRIRCPESLSRVWIDLGSHRRTQTSTIRFCAERGSSRAWKITWGTCALYEHFVLFIKESREEQPLSPKLAEGGSDASITRLFPELRHYILSYLPLKDVKSCSSCCQLLNVDSQSFLWNFVAVSPNKSPQETLGSFTQFLLSNPQRAGRIKSLAFYKITYQLPQAGGPVDLVSFQKEFGTHPASIESPNNGINEAFSHLHGLKRLKITPGGNWTATSSDDMFAPYPRALYNALACSPAALTLETLIVHEPPEVLQTLLNTFLNIANLAILSRSPTSMLSSKVLLNLRRAHGSSKILSWLALNRKYGLLEFVMDNGRDSEPVMFGSTLQRFPLLKKLSYVGDRESFTNPLPLEPMDKLAHSALEELELELHYTSWMGRYPSPALLLLSIVSPVFINSFPSLRFLHIGHFYQVFFPPFMQEPSNVELQDPMNNTPLVQDAELQGLSSELASFLVGTQSPTSFSRLWIDLGSRHNSQTRAVRFCADRADDGSWKVTFTACEPYEQFVTIQELPPRVYRGLELR
ncbi:hypothetical protein DL93DRAFT_2154708 [Clavulina sp. PMI_390]|nr:hypothetical protein DL93DRAFT_2154708 [Clavulina sp. PMI_390]